MSCASRWPCETGIFTVRYSKKLGSLSDYRSAGPKLGAKLSSGSAPRRSSHAPQDPMDTSEGILEADDRVNELYWGSDKSANQIAEELDLSKGAFYAMIRPLASALSCPRCGHEVTHSNRTAKERGQVDCHACSWSGTGDDTLPYESTAEEFGAGATLAPPEQLLDVRTRAIAGGALLGAAVGLALVLWAWRK